MNSGRSRVKDQKGAEGLRLCIVVSRFNLRVTDRLLNGSLSVIKKHGIASESVEIVNVPGAFEIPGVALLMGRSGRFDAIICLGAVIRGETDHYQYICAEVSRGIGDVALALGLPVIFGVLTTSSLQQAMARSGTEMNKGAESAEVAIEMGRLYKSLKKKVAPVASKKGKNG